MTAYTTPQTINTGDLLTATMFNEQLVRNIKHLHEAANSLIILQDQKAQNTDGGTFTQGAWQTRTLNTEVTDVNSLCALSSNQFTLEAGTYEAWWSAPGYRVDGHQTRIQNVTDGTTVATGTTEYDAATDNNSNTHPTATRSVGWARFTVAASKALELQHRCTATHANQGFGRPTNVTTEVYSMIVLRKISD